MSKKKQELVKKEEAQITPEFTDEKIKDFIRMQIGDEVFSKLEDRQIEYFLQMAHLYNLNPFKREIYLLPFKVYEYDPDLKKKIDTGRYDVSIVIGYETYLKRAERSGKLAGWRVWTEGDRTRGMLKGCIEIYRKDWVKPFYHEVDYSEYSNGKTFWSGKPKTMIKKVAIAQGFRLAFPEEVGGLPYIEEEISQNMQQIEQQEGTLEERIEEIKELIQDERIDDKTRDIVNSALAKGISEGMAIKYIERLKKKIKEASIEQETAKETTKENKAKDTKEDKDVEEENKTDAVGNTEEIDNNTIATDKQKQIFKNRILKSHTLEEADRRIFKDMFTKYPSHAIKEGLRVVNERKEIEEALGFKGNNKCPAEILSFVSAIKDIEHRNKVIEGLKGIVDEPDIRSPQGINRTIVKATEILGNLDKKEV